MSLPEDNASSGSGGDIGLGPSDTKDDIALLEAEDETLEAPPDAEGETTEEDEEEEGETTEPKEEKIEDEEDEEKKEEEITRLSYKDIKDKYPKIFKEFPELRDVFFSEKAYREIFPTVEEAREATEKTEIFDHLNQSLTNGRPDILLKALSDQTLQQFAENILPALHNRDRGLFARATQGVIAEMLNSAHEHADTNNDKNMKLSVMNLCKFLYGKFELPNLKHREVSPELEKEKQALKNERAQLYMEKAQDNYTKVEKSIEKRLKRSIENNLDPDSLLSDFTRNSVIQATVDETASILKNDKLHTDRMKSLWKIAEKGNFAPESITRLISAYLGRAEQLALRLRSKHKSAALGKREPPKAERKIPSGTSAHPRSTSTRNPDAKSVDWKRTDDLAFLEDRVTMKK